MLLSDLLVDIEILRLEGNPDIKLSGIEFDSRKLAPGYLFVATVGTTLDGHDYINAAIEKGATAVVCERMPVKLHKNVTYVQVPDSAEALGYMASTWFGHPSEKLILVGVTGTNGKTTVATLLYQLFKEIGYKAGLLSTVCNYVDDKAIETTHTTPDALTLNTLLHQMVDAGCQYAFMEVSSHAIEQRRIAG
ncbi:MAG: UDP-N-acetylmuramoyl-L-alanyl-D-glutamate--2,6-diaminopimelate ligase, partial [Bacteroidales bacterium]|nr:UDP-N-acetylmuramoyl-L-alanyl-D-glutamate--2,6-diaminopimelate ligase [Bacteroidales bacterium]